MKAKLQVWRIQRSQNNTELMARRFLYQQTCGASVSFKRCGVDFPEHAIKTFIEQNPTQRDSEDPLPEHIEELYSTTSHEAIHSQNGSGSLNQSVNAGTAAHVATPLLDGCSDEQRQNKKRKLPCERVNPSCHQDPDELGDTCDEHYHTEDSNIHGKKGLRFGGNPNSQSLVAQKKKVEKAFAMLRQVFPTSTEATEAIKYTEKVLTSTLKSESTIQLEEDETDLGPLHSAAISGDLKTAAVLLQYNADINARGRLSTTALHFAVWQGHHEFVKFLLTQPKIDFDAVDGHNSTALHVATFSDDDDCIQLLLAAGADLNIKDEIGRTPTMYACSRASVKTLSLVLDADPDLTLKDNEGYTALHDLCRRGLDDIVVQILDDLDVDINACTTFGATPLMLAASNGHERTVRILVENDADLNAMDIDSNTALRWAIKNGFTEIAEFLIKMGSPVNPFGQPTSKWRAKFENEGRIQQGQSPARPRAASKLSDSQSSRPRDMEFDPQYRSASRHQVIRYSTQESTGSAATTADAGADGRQRSIPAYPNVGSEPSLVSNSIYDVFPPALPFDYTSASASEFFRAVSLAHEV